MIFILEGCPCRGSSRTNLAKKMSASRSDNHPLPRIRPAVFRGDEGMRNKANNPAAIKHSSSAIVFHSLQPKRRGHTDSADTADDEDPAKAKCC